MMTMRLETLQRDEHGVLLCGSLEMLVRVVKTMRFKLKCAQFMEDLAKTCGNKLSFHSLCFDVKKEKRR